MLRKAPCFKRGFVVLKKTFSQLHFVINLIKLNLVETKNLFIMIISFYSIACLVFMAHLTKQIINGKI